MLIFGVPLAEYLEARWQLDRTVSTGEVMTGVAMLSASSSSELRYEENVSVTLTGGKKLEGFRSYIYQVNEDGFDICFDESPQRLFQHIELEPISNGFEGSCSHLCGGDIYNSKIEILNDKRMRVTHQVKGPKKNYTSISILEKSQIT